jgi:hypothetical protein
MKATFSVSMGEGDDDGAPAGEPFDLLRVWSQGPDLFVQLDAELFSDPGQAGILLADIARYYARAFADAGRGESDDLLASIRDCFESESSQPDTAAAGGLTN